MKIKHLIDGKILYKLRVEFIAIVPVFKRIYVFDGLRFYHIEPKTWKDLVWIILKMCNLNSKN